MVKKNISTEIFAFVPITCTMILSTRMGDQINFMALAWLTRCNYSPPMIAISVNKSHFSCAAILNTGEFGLNLPSTEMTTVTDYVGLVSARTQSKSALFQTFEGTLKNAPLIEECPINAECQIRERIELPTNFLFVGEIVGVYAHETVLADGTIDWSKCRPFLLTMPDNRYWSLGECVGQAWKDGKRFRP